MKRCVVPFLAVILLSVVQICWGDVSQNVQSHITWLTNYDEAISQSTAQSKPLLMLFTGTGWCPACTKLEKEILSTPDFAEVVGNQFIFLKLDFPQNFRTSPQNEQLKTRYDVRYFPTIIVLNAKQQQIGTTGYRPGNPRAYAAHLLKFVSDYQAYMQKMDSLNQKKVLKGSELQQMYVKASDLRFYDDVNAIVAAGMNSDLKPYFQLERYRILADEGRLHEMEAINLRQQLVTSDPTNERKTHYHLAIIDFEAYSDESPELACEPLTAYIEKFGKQDPNNVWKLEMLISQVYLDKDKLSQALKYAQDSYEVAPANVRPDIAMAIKNIKAIAR